MNERFEGLEKRTNERFADVDRRFNDIDKRFNDIDKRFDRAEREAERRHAELISYLSLEARLRKIEAEHAHEPQKSQSSQPQETRS